MGTGSESEEDSTLSAPLFALVLFVTVVVVALLGELPLAVIVGRQVSFEIAFENGVLAGGVFAGIYLAGTLLMGVLEDNDE